MWNNAKYVLIYLGELLALGALSYLLADRFNRFAHRFSKSRVIEKITVLFFLSLAGLSLILPYFMLQSWPGVVPPFLKGESVHKPPSVDIQLEEDLRSVATAAEELNRSMTKTLENFGALRIKVKEQQRQFSELTRAVAAERRKAEEARERAKRENLKPTEDAQDAANKLFIYGVLVSFPLGILSSLIASMLYRNLKER